jgi:hypothetical protein
MSQQHFAIGNAQIVTPDGWTSVSQTDEKLVLCSSRQQQATISVMHFDNDATFEQFKTLCDIRIKGEMQFAPDGFVERETPFKDQTGFGMFFYGGDKKSGRIFFGYLSLVQRELVTIYVEGVGVDPQAHSSDFRTFVTGLKRN